MTVHLQKVRHHRGPGILSDRRPTALNPVTVGESPRRMEPIGIIMLKARNRLWQMSCRSQTQFSECNQVQLLQSRRRRLLDDGLDIVLVKKPCFFLVQRFLPVLKLTIANTPLGYLSDSSFLRVEAQCKPIILSL